MNSELERLFLNQEPAQILVILRRREAGLSEICSRLGTYNEYTAELLEEMEHKHLVVSEDNQHYNLTSHGKSLAESILQFLSLTESISVQVKTSSNQYDRSMVVPAADYEY